VTFVLLAYCDELPNPGQMMVIVFLYEIQAIHHSHRLLQTRMYDTAGKQFGIKFLHPQLKSRFSKLAENLLQLARKRTVKFPIKPSPALTHEHTIPRIAESGPRRSGVVETFGVFTRRAPDLTKRGGQSINHKPAPSATEPKGVLSTCSTLHLLMPAWDRADFIGLHNGQQIGIGVVDADHAHEAQTQRERCEPRAPAVNSRAYLSLYLSKYHCVLRNSDLLARSSAFQSHYRNRQGERGPLSKPGPSPQPAGRARVDMPNPASIRVAALVCNHSVACYDGTAVNVHDKDLAYLLDKV
jgi:hypothetical protein